MPLSDEDEVFDIEVDDAGSETSLMDINDQRSGDINSFNDDCNDIDIEN